MYVRLIGLCILCFSFAHGQDIGSDNKTDSSVVTDAELQEEIAKALSGADTLLQQNPQNPRNKTGYSSNPRISVIGSFLTSFSDNRSVAKKFNLGLTETEISFQSYIDPYAKADFYVAFHNDIEDPFRGPDPDAAANGEFEVELEEAYLTTLSLPFAMQIKAGKFRSNFGRINRVHPHSLDFIDLPRMYVNYFGKEGLGDKGIALNWLIPNPLNLYQELSLEITSGALEGPSFQGGSDNLLYLSHLKTFLDLRDNHTLEIGLSGLHGANDDAGHKTTIYGIDATYKWKPVRFNTYRSLEVIAEGLWSHQESRTARVHSNAFFVFVRNQVTKRWFAGARYDYSEFPDNIGFSEKAYSGIIAFQLSEFQKLECQYTRGTPAKADEFNRILVRAVFVIGAHGAHAY